MPFGTLNQQDSRHNGVTDVLANQGRFVFHSTDTATTLGSDISESPAQRGLSPALVTGSPVIAIACGWRNW